MENSSVAEAFTNFGVCELITLWILGNSTFVPGNLGTCFFHRYRRLLVIILMITSSIQICVVDISIC